MPAKSDVQCADLSLREGNNPGAAECHALGNPGNVLKITADAIKRLREEHVGATALDVGQRSF